MVLQRDDSAIVAYLRSPRSIRDRCQQLFDLAMADRLQYFRCDLSQLESVADYVIQVTCASYPDLNIPFHSRWRHFDIGGVPRVAHLDAKLAGLSALEIARAKFDLAIVSVLLDAGAGASWQYQEAETGQVWTRSEGLAVATLHQFCAGIFSSSPTRPLQVDAVGLQKLTAATLAASFQSSDTNPLVGLPGRLTLLQRLGAVIQQLPHLFGEDTPRPGHLVDYLLTRTTANQLAASTVLNAVLEGLGDIWNGRIYLGGVNLGDVWVHPALIPADREERSPHPASLVPFHKLSQWLTYSLLEPLQDLGITITELDALTGLPEYRNGGLCLDLGLLQVKDPEILERVHRPGDVPIVEWRAITVILLDQIAATMRQRLQLEAIALPLVKVLQGGTWTAGRQIAASRRSGGIPPLQIESDGTVF